MTNLLADQHSVLDQRTKQMIHLLADQVDSVLGLITIVFIIIKMAVVTLNGLLTSIQRR